MELKFQVQARIEKPVEEVFDAVADTKKLSAYFTTGGPTQSLEEGATVLWKFQEFPDQNQTVKVIKLRKNEEITLEWKNMGIDYSTRVEMKFEDVDGKSTVAKISEEGWKNDRAGLEGSYSNCNGWSQMLTCLKGYLEYGINLREGYW